MTKTQMMKWLSGAGVALFIFLFISIICFYPAPTRAEEARKELYAINGVGLVLTITNETCDKQAPPGVKWWKATTENLDGTVTEGCWLFAVDAPAIIIHWENGYATNITDPGVFLTKKPEFPQVNI